MVSGSHCDPKRSGFALSRQLLRALWLAALLAVIVGSLLSSKAAPIQMLERLPLSDKVEHVAMYALLAFLPAIHERRSVAINVAWGAIALGVALEFAQFLTGWRDFEIGDMIANAVGVCVGLASGAAVRTRVRHRLY